MTKAAKPETEALDETAAGESIKAHTSASATKSGVMIF